MPENEKPVLIAHPSCKSFEFIQIKQTILDHRKGRPLYWLSHKKKSYIYSFLEYSLRALLEKSIEKLQNSIA
jgi:hypothetical protein